VKYTNAFVLLGRLRQVGLQHGQCVTDRSTMCFLAVRW
jgi:hypothetical protein